MEDIDFLMPSILSLFLSLTTVESFRMNHILEILFNRSELKIFKEKSYFFFHSGDPGVMPYPFQERRINLGVLGIEFPGMDVNHDRFSTFCNLAEQCFR